MRNRTGKLLFGFCKPDGNIPAAGNFGNGSSLLSLVEDMADVQGNFYGALTLPSGAWFLRSYLSCSTEL